MPEKYLYGTRWKGGYLDKFVGEDKNLCLCWELNPSLPAYYLANIQANSKESVI